MEWLEADGVLVLRLFNDLTSNNVASVRDSILAKFKASPDYTIFMLDMGGAKKIDSIGVNLIVGLYKTTQLEKKGYELINCSDAILKVLKLFKLDTHFKIG